MVFGYMLAQLLPWSRDRKGNCLVLGTANVDDALRKDVCVLCMHVYMYACIHVYMYACVYVCIYICMHVCWMWSCDIATESGWCWGLQMWMRHCVRMFVFYVCLIYMYACIYVCIYICTHLYMYAFIYVFMYVGCSHVIAKESGWC